MKIFKILTLPYFFLNFFFEILKYKFFKINNSNTSYYMMIYFFSIFGGISNSIINFFLKKKGSLNINIKNDIKYDIISTTKNLKENGYIKKSKFLKYEEVEIIKNKILNLTGRYDDDKIKNTDPVKLDLNNPKSIRYKYNSSDLIKIPEIQDLIINENILKVVETYLGSIPIIEYCESWWSFPSDYEDDSAAQMWHFDMDRPRWLKVFIFLNDCNLDNGGHLFIKKTHKNFGIPFGIRKKGYSRISNDIIKKTFSESEIILMDAKAGDILFEDTIGLHKGKNLKKGNRLILQFQYSSALFGSKPQMIKMPKTKTENFKYHLKNNDYLFLNFK